jgi:hypothetical protein
MRKRPPEFLCVAVMLLATGLMAAGCSSLGAKAMKGERTNLNVPLQQPSGRSR